jgi:hypothetical protein
MTKFYSVCTDPPPTIITNSTALGLVPKFSIFTQYMFIKLLLFFSAVEEIMNITQADLVTDDVMMLDVYDIIFLWIGNNSNKEERDMAVPMVMEYLRTGDYKIYTYYEHRVFIIS